MDNLEKRATVAAEAILHAYRADKARGLVLYAEALASFSLPASKMHAEINRALTPYEKRADMKAVDARLREIEGKYLVKLKDIIAKQRDTLTAFISTKQVKDQLTLSLVSSGIDLKYKGELKSIARSMMADLYDSGRKDAKAELPRKHKTAHAITLPPQQASDYLNAKADFMVDGITEPLTADIKAVLLRSIKNGQPVRETISELQSAFEPYLADGSVIVDGEQLTSYRLETLVRTNNCEAYNYGRRAIGEDPELDGYVVGYQFSEILDDRTTDLSRFVDGKIISVDSPYLDELTYPLHWNDRGMFVFVTKDDLPVEFISDADAEEAIREKNI